MKISSDLGLMRKEWLNSFYSLDTEQLDYLQTDWFFATNGIKFLPKKSQLHKLRMLKAQTPSAFSGYRREEIDVEVREFGGIAAVSGSAIIYSPDGEKRINFIEGWIKINDCWKLQFQSFEGDE